MALVDVLSGWPRERLTRLLTLRPDLRTAADVRELARLATSPTSTLAAVQDLPARHRTVLEAVVLLAPGSDEDDLLALDPDVDRADVLGLLADLRDRLLVTDGGLAAIGMVRQYLPVPLGLGRTLDQVHEHTPLYELATLLDIYGEPAPRTKVAARARLAEVLGDTAAMAASLPAMPAAQLEALRRYDRDGPVLREPGLNVWEHRPPTDPAVRRLLDVGLLAVTASGTVELPREIGLALRHPAVCRFAPPEIAGGREVSSASVLAAAAAAVGDVLARCDALLARVGSQKVGLLASGGVGVKDLRAIGKDLGVEPGGVSTLLAVLRGLGVLTTTSKDLRVSSGQGAWSKQDDGARWSDLVRAWLAMVDQPASSRKLTAALSWGAHDARVRRSRERLLLLLDATPSLACTADEWLDRWHARWPEGRRTSHDRAGELSERELRGDVLQEAVRLGLLVDGVATLLLGPLLAGDDVDAALADAAGAGEVRVLAQADLTLVCTGRPSRALKLALDRIADVESAAQATVWRLSEQSLTRAYDEGDTPEQVLAVLDLYAEAVPQPMAYLVRDAHRRHGRVRVGSAVSYVVVDDDALLVTAIGAKGTAGKALSGLGVRRIAPGVAVSRGSVEATVTALRKAGVPAVAETSRAPAKSAPSVRRAPAGPSRLAPLPARVDDRDVDGAVERLLDSR